MNTEIRAPGEKWSDYTSSYIQPSEPHVAHDQPRRSSISTAHIASTIGSMLKNERAEFAFDLLVSECADFFCSRVDTTVTNFAESMVTLLSNPTAIDPVEMKRRIEQILPVKGSHYNHCRGSVLSDREFTRLCHYAGLVVEYADDKELLHIVDEENEENEEIKQNNIGEVQYIRSSPIVSLEQIPSQIPSFLEQGDEERFSSKIEYDLDVTPYDSEADEPIRMT